MIWKNLWNFLKSIWRKIANRKTSSKSNTALDTASLKVFGLEIKVTRELPVDIPYELTIVVPRAEIRGNKTDRSAEVILSSITIAHSPRSLSELAQEKPVVPTPKKAA